MFGLEPIPDGKVFFDRNSMILARLRQEAHAAYTRMERPRSPSLHELVASTSEFLQSHPNGDVRQLKTLTSVSCSAQRAASIVWRSIATTLEIPGKLYKVGLFAIRCTLLLNSASLINPSTVPMRV